jgi:hypothetical protein
VGTYATTTSLEALLPDYTFDTATSALASKLIVRAEGEVNKYLSRRYDLSSSTFRTAANVPPLVTSLTEQLSEGWMHIGNSRGGKESLKRGQEIVKAAIENLQMLAEYKGDLTDSTGAVIQDMTAPSNRILCTTSDYMPTFDVDGELSQKVDADQLDDVYNARD